MNEFNPYEAPRSAVEDLPEIQELGLASRGTRLGAAILDGVFWLAAFSPFVLQGLMFERARHGGGAPMGGIWLIAGGIALIGLLIWNLIWLANSGQTIAKRLLHIRIVRSSGETASLGRIFWLRMALPGVIGRFPFVGWIFSLVDALFIFGQEKRCLHDLMADTIVIQA
ncbi:MAG TPA: RDD family protein [Holophagaceae bacterium]|nr:RDD family protein [Holophagaceae bacterium]